MLNQKEVWFELKEESRILTTREYWIFSMVNAVDENAINLDSLRKKIKEQISQEDQATVFRQVLEKTERYRSFCVERKCSDRIWTGEFRPKAGCTTSEFLEVNEVFTLTLKRRLEKPRFSVFDSRESAIQSAEHFIWGSTDTTWKRKDDWMFKKKTVYSCVHKGERLTIVPTEVKTRISVLDESL